MCLCAMTHRVVQWVQRRVRLHLKQSLECEAGGLPSHGAVAAFHAVERMARDALRHKDFSGQYDELNGGRESAPGGSHNAVAARFLPLRERLRFCRHPRGLQLVQRVRGDDVGEDNEAVLVKELRESNATVRASQSTKGHISRLSGT